MRRLLALGRRLGGVIRWPRAFFAFAPIAIPLIFGTVTTGPVTRQAASAMVTIPAPQVRYADLTAPPPNPLPEHSVFLQVSSGDTLDSVLRAGGVGAEETAVLTREFGKSIDLRRLRPGNLLRFHYGEGNRVDSVQMKVTGWGDVVAVRNGDHFDVRAQEAHRQEVDTSVAASIETSLYSALSAAGESPQLAQHLVDVFQWDIDFFALQKGDSFSLVVKKRFAGSDAIGYGPIEAARFVHNGQVYEAFRYESSAGQAGYYGRSGTPLKKQFLRAPLKFTRITSRFSRSRFHPILHYFRPHHGVDYGAPVGTPVMSTADGVVVEAARSGGEGNFVRIRHTSRIETMYLHLSRFARGIRPGARVQQGEVIGYVGATGLVTGPHLDYRVSDAGNWLDPLKLKSITPDPLHGESLRQFRAGVDRLMPRLETTTPQLAAQANRPRVLF
jgi:murein DD-endopeptidase MepM/ murein hydrolase activator NlpD